MSFKTGGVKTKYIEEYGYIRNEYTIYCAVESVSDICVYKMFNEDEEEVDIIISCEDDSYGIGNHSLVDCLYYLKHHRNKIYKNRETYNIKIFEMSDDEMNEIFG